MKIKKVEIEPTKFLDLNFDLTKTITLKLPNNIEGVVVRINVTYKKGEYKKDIIDKILDEIKKNKPAKVFFGNIKAIGLDDEREEVTLDAKMSRQELIDNFVELYAPKQLKPEIVDVLKEMNNGK